MRIAALCALGVVAFSGAGAQRVRIIHRDTTAADSLWWVGPEFRSMSLDQLVQRLNDTRELEQSLAFAMRSANGDNADPQRMQDLAEQLRRIARQSAGLVSTIELRCASQGRAAGPEGFIGVSLNIDGEVTRRRGEPELYYFRTRPSIASVEPGSPAERAGLEAGDVLLRIGQADPQHGPFAFDSVLKPGVRLPIRVLRDGTSRNVTVLVGKRPAPMTSPCADVDELLGPERSAPAVQIYSFRSIRVPEGPRGAAAPPPVKELPGDGFGLALIAPAYSGGITPVAGATLMAINDDWRQTLGVDHGLVVLRVLPGTPAKSAGLRASDVLLSADETPLTSARLLARILGASTSHSVKLQLFRAGKAESAVLRW